MHIYFLDATVSFLTGLIAHGGCIDAITFKHSKSRMKAFFKGLPLLNRLLKIYPITFSCAPRHLIFFQVVRMINILSFLISVSLYTLIISQNQEICELIFFCKLLVIQFPFFVYCLNPKYRKPRSKRFDFSKFRNP